MATQTLTPTASAVLSPAPSPRPVVDPGTGAFGGWTLPAGLRDTVRALPQASNLDTVCPACQGPLFVRLDVVRMRRGYELQGGSLRGYLLACLACGQVLNPDEVREW